MIAEPVTDRTWNPWVGCTKVSAGCANCYMFRQQQEYGRDPTVVRRTKTWGEPLKWQRAAARGCRGSPRFLPTRAPGQSGDRGHHARPG